MLTIRLQRSGKRNQPEFRIVLAEKTASAAKKFVEILGNYNPRNKVFSIQKDRLDYWVSQKVELSPTMHNLLVSQKLLDLPKVKAFSIPKKPAVPVVEPQATAQASAQPESTAPSIKQAANAEVSSEQPSETTVAEASPETSSSPES